jgi:broad specificity phosphatase PhoE
MKTTIYLVRHGDVHNPDGVFYERIPGFRLSDLGNTQAHALGKFLSTKTIAAIYASPLQRTQETATIVASYHATLSVVSDDRLIEVSSIKRGQKQAELAMDRWNFYLPKYTKQGGEKLSDIWRRMKHVIGEKVKAHQGQEIILVSHGDPIMISRAKYRGKPLALSSIRGEGYVQTAKGVALVFDESGIVDVSDLDF